jgi:hypothetical protein
VIPFPTKNKNKKLCVACYLSMISEGKIIRNFQNTRYDEVVPGGRCLES